MKLKCMILVSIGLLTSQIVSAAQPPLPAPGEPVVIQQAQPTPATEAVPPAPTDAVPPAPADVAPPAVVEQPAATPQPVADVPIVLFACVEVEDTDNIAPCAQPLIVSVADPCNPGCCRYVEICVPTCGCAKVRCSLDGTRLTYDYGEYEITVKSRVNSVEVNYDD